MIQTPLNSKGKTSSNTYKWDLEYLAPILLLKFKFLLLISITISILQPDRGCHVQHSNANIACNEVSGDTGSLLSPITPRKSCWRNGLITQIPRLQEFGWTHDGEGSCSCNYLLPPRSLQRLLRRPSRRRYKTCSKNSSWQGSVLFSSPLQGSCQPVPTQPTLTALGSKSTFTTKEQQVLCASAKGMPHFPKLLLLHRNTQFPHIHEILLIYPVC